MTDITNIIAELEELLKKVPQVKWEYKRRKKCGPNIFFRDESRGLPFNNYLFDHQCDWGEDVARLIVETHNALPELIAGYERYRQEVVRLLARMHEKSNEVNSALARTEKAEAALELVAKHNSEHQDAEIDFYTRLELANARAERMQAERDWLALQLQRIHNGCVTRKAEKEWWLKMAAQEAAKRQAGEEV